MSSNTEEEDYLDRLGRVLPWQRSFTSNEKIFVILIVGTFVSIVGCTLLCLLCSQSCLRRRYYARKKLEKERSILLATAPRVETLVYTAPPPCYESIVSAEDMTNPRTSRLTVLGRKLSNTTASDSDGIQSNAAGFYPLLNNEKTLRSFVSNGDTGSAVTNDSPFASYPQVDAELDIDTTKNTLIVHLTHGKCIPSHPAFDEQAEFFIHLQLLNNKILKKFRDGWRKRQSNLQWSTWRKFQEKSTKKLSRMADDTLVCDEYLQFELNQDDMTNTSLRFLLFCIDRSGIQDLISEAVIRLEPSMIPSFKQVIALNELSQIAFSEINLGLSYLPTAERFTIKINKLRYFCKIEKEQKADARLIVTFLHHGRRFAQKKLPPIPFDQSTSSKDSNVYEIKDTIIQNIPRNDIQSIYIHFELVLHLIHAKDESILSCGSILLGEQTPYRTTWQQMLEQPRQIHLGWHQFFG